jgi:hypothetical protein
VRDADRPSARGPRRASGLGKLSHSHSKQYHASRSRKGGSWNLLSVKTGDWSSIWAQGSRALAVLRWSWLWARGWSTDLAPLAVPICTRAAIHLSGRVVSLRSRAVLAGLPGSQSEVSKVQGPRSKVGGVKVAGGGGARTPASPGAQKEVTENVLFPTAVQDAARVRWRRKARERPGRRKSLSDRRRWRPGDR